MDFKGSRILLYHHRVIYKQHHYSLEVKSDIKKQISKIKYNTNWANAKKTTKDTLVEEFEIAKKELVKLAITKETRDKLRILTRIADTIDKAGEEEKQVREDLNNIILKSEKNHGLLSERLITLDD